MTSSDLLSLTVSEFESEDLESLLLHALRGEIEGLQERERFLLDGDLDDKFSEDSKVRRHSRGLIGDSPRSREDSGLSR